MEEKVKHFTKMSLLGCLQQGSLTSIFGRYLQQVNKTQELPRAECFQKMHWLGEELGVLGNSTYAHDCSCSDMSNTRTPNN